MGPPAVVEAEISPDQGAGLRYAGVGPQADLLLFEGPPQAFDEDVVPPGPLAIHADFDLANGQRLDELGPGELAALIGVEYLWLAVAGQRFLGLRCPSRPPA